MALNIIVLLKFRAPHIGLNVTVKKQTLYEMLGIAPNASLDEIKVAHKMLSRKLLTGELNLSREDVNFQLKLINVALNTLSDQASRDAYDAQLSTPAPPGNVALPLDASTASLRNVATTLTAVSETEENHRFPLQIVSKTVAGTVSSLKKILRIIIGLAVLAVVFKISTWSLANNQRVRSPDEVSKAEEKVILQEYYLTHGVRPASKEEADLLEIENRRRENAQRAAALEKQKKDEEYKKFVEESMQRGEQVSADLQREEERARGEAEQEKLEREEAERNRIEEDRQQVEAARRKLGLD